MSKSTKKYKGLLLPSMSSHELGGRTPRFSREQIEAALRKHDGNQRSAAAELGTSHQNLGQLVRSLQIDPSLYRQASPEVVQSRLKTAPTKAEIEAALEQSSGNQSLAAKALGVSQGFLSKQIKKTGVAVSFYMGPKKEAIGAYKFRVLSSFVADMWGEAENVLLELSKADVAKRMAEVATVIAYKKYGNVLAQAPAMANVAGLTVSMLAEYSRLRLSQVRPAAARLARETEIRSLPSETPKTLRRAWLWEVSNPETDRLFGDTVAIGGYWFGSTCHIIGQQYPDGIRVISWRPVWGASDPEAGADQPLSDKEMGFIELGSFDEHQRWSKEAIHFCLAMGILLEAYESPLSVRKEDGKRNTTRPKGQPLHPNEWSTDHIYLTVEPKPRPLTQANIPPKPNPDAVAETVIVKGYLRRQRFGARNAEIRWVWISPYEAIRWHSGKPKRTIVH